MPTRNVHLNEHLNNFIASGIESGQFSNASEVVREGLRLLEQRQQQDSARIEWLRHRTAEAFAAFDQGEGVPFPSADSIDTFVNDAVEENRATRRTSHA